MTKIILLMLLGFLIICAIAVSLTKNLLVSVIIYMSYSLVMSLIWIFLQSPDLAITEAAVGAGITSILFFVTLRKIDAVEEPAAEESTDTTAADPAAEESEDTTAAEESTDTTAADPVAAESTDITVADPAAAESTDTTVADPAAEEERHDRSETGGGRL